MNNKGQTLIMFILLIPIIFILCAFIIDKSYLLIEKNKQNNIGNIVCSHAKKNFDINEIKKLALENDSSYKKIEIKIKENNINITLEKEIESIFKNKKYTIKTKTKCKN